MTQKNEPFLNVFRQYLTKLYQATHFDGQLIDLGPEVEKLAVELRKCWAEERQVFICGNGGSAGNANHIANDLIYPIAKKTWHGIRTHALSANPATITCIANDEGYKQIFSIQLMGMAQPGDVLIVLSGSGNSPNILEALAQAKRMSVKTFAILGFDGGKAKAKTDHPIHIPVQDMQIAEDLQLVIAHMIVQWLAANNPFLNGDAQ